MKNVFKLTNKYIILTTPLILFSLISTFYLAITASGNVINVLFSILLSVLMSVAFISGWFYMVKNAVINNRNDENANNLIVDFPSGVGEYFLPSLGLMINIILLFILCIAFTHIVGVKFIGVISIPTDVLVKSLSNTANLKTFLMSLSTEQLVILNKWVLLLFGAMTCFYFLVMFYLPSLFFKSKNPYKALFLSFKDLFSRHIFKNIGLFMMIYGGYCIFSLLSALCVAIPILHFIVLFANFYYFTFMAVCLFYFYNKIFVESQLGKNIDTRI